MNNFRLANPNLYALTIAMLMAAFAYFLMATDNFGLTHSENTQSVLMRTAYVAATSLLMFDVLETACIGRNFAGKKRTIHFLIYAFYMGYFWMLLMVLMNWEGMQNASAILLQWGGAGVFFGLAMSWFVAPKSDRLEHRYDLDKPATGHSFGFLYYVWPLMVVALIVGLLFFQPEGDWEGGYFLFMLVFSGTTMQLYYFKKDIYWAASWPRTLGTGLLLSGLFWL